MEQLLTQKDAQGCGCDGGEGGRCSHKFISCPIQALPFLDLAKCVDSLQTPTNTHTHTDAHTYMNSYANTEHTYMGHCRCIARPSHAAHTHTQRRAWTKACTKIIRCVHFMYTHARTQTGPKTHNVIEAQANTQTHTDTDCHCVHVQFELAVELNLHLLCDFRTSRSDLQVI